MLTPTDTRTSVVFHALLRGVWHIFMKTNGTLVYCYEL